MKIPRSKSVPQRDGEIAASASEVAFRRIEFRCRGGGQGSSTRSGPPPIGGWEIGARVLELDRGGRGEERVLEEGRGFLEGF